MESKARVWIANDGGSGFQAVGVIVKGPEFEGHIELVEYSALEEEKRQHQVARELLNESDGALESAQAEIAELRAENERLASRLVEHPVYKLSKTLEADLKSAMEMISVMEEALDYYSKPYVNGGVWIGRISHHEAHGDDMEMIEAFSFAGKLARKALAALEAWKGKRE